jgi:hypothetical protein
MTETESTGSDSVQDGLRSWREWQDHMNDPGHWLGGNVPPFLRTRRRNPYGFVLLFGAMMLLCLASGPLLFLLGGLDSDWFSAVAPLALTGGSALLLGLAGIRLLRGPRPSNGTKRDERR